MTSGVGESTSGRSYSSVSGIRIVGLGLWFGGCFGGEEYKWEMNREKGVGSLARRLKDRGDCLLLLVLWGFVLGRERGL